MSSRSQARVERIRERIDISQVLIDYGYYVHMGAEHQFSCDLHGDGRDGKPSARVYPESASWYCFACDRSRDAIETVREKEGIGFMEAIKYLERRYNLPPLPWDDEKDARVPETNPFEETFQRARTYEEERSDAESFLNDLTYDRDMPLDLLLGLWEAYDMICYRMRKSEGGTQSQGWTDELGAQSMARLLVMAKDKTAEHNRAQ